jgi:hypothetical protein
MDDVFEYVTDLYHDIYVRRAHAFRFQLTLRKLRHAFYYDNLSIYRKVSKTEYERTPQRSHGPFIDLADFAACGIHLGHVWTEGSYMDYYILRDVNDSSHSYKSRTLPSCVSFQCLHCYPKYRPDKLLCRKES